MAYISRPMESRLIIKEFFRVCRVMLYDYVPSHESSTRGFLLISSLCIHYDWMTCPACCPAESEFFFLDQFWVWLLIACLLREKLEGERLGYLINLKDSENNFFLNMNCKIMENKKRFEKNKIMMQFLLVKVDIVPFWSIGW